MPTVQYVTSAAAAKADDVPFVSGGMYGPTFQGVSLNSAVMTQDELNYFPIWIPNACTIDRIGLECITLAGSTFFRLGLYSGASALGNVPTTLLVDGGQVSSGTTGLKTVTVSQIIAAPGWFWIACVAQGGAPAARTNSGNKIPWIPVTGAGNPVAIATGYVETGISGALTTPGTLTVGSNPYFPYIRVA